MEMRRINTLLVAASAGLKQRPDYKYLNHQLTFFNLIGSLSISSQSEYSQINNLKNEKTTS
jgi:hypothetical protein